MSAEDFSDEALHRYFEDLLRTQKYRLMISEVGTAYPDLRSINIEFEDVDNFNRDLAEYLLLHPIKSLRLAGEAVGAVLPPDIQHPLSVRVSHIPATSNIRIRDLRGAHLGKFLAINGIVRKVTEVRPRLTEAHFRCARCGFDNIIPQDDMVVHEPYECEGCQKSANQTSFLFQQDFSIYIDTQKIEIQENPEGLRGGEQPQRLTAFIEDDIAGRVSPGDRITINGVLMSRQKHSGKMKSTVFDIHLAVNSLEVDKSDYEEVNITEDDTLAIEELSRNPGIYQKLTNSIAPTIYGLDVEKEALTLQLFGGVRKFMPDGTRIRGDIHILLVGDPGTAKSQLLRYISQISPRGIYTSGQATTKAGLTATAVKEEFGDGRWTLEAGALVLADKGIACLLPGTEVRAGGSWVRIEELFDGDRATTISSFGESVEVSDISGSGIMVPALSPGDPPGDQGPSAVSTPATAVRRKKYSGEVLDITFESGNRLSVTPDHLLLDGTTLAWKEAGHFSKRDLVVAPFKSALLDRPNDTLALVEVLCAMAAGRDQQFQIELDRRGRSDILRSLLRRNHPDPAIKREILAFLFPGRNRNAEDDPDEFIERYLRSVGGSDTVSVAERAFPGIGGPGTGRAPEPGPPAGESTDPGPERTEADPGRPVSPTGHTGKPLTRGLICRLVRNLPPDARIGANPVVFIGPGGSEEYVLDSLPPPLFYLFGRVYTDDRRMVRETRPIRLLFQKFKRSYPDEYRTICTSSVRAPIPPSSRLLEGLYYHTIRDGLAHLLTLPDPCLRAFLAGIIDANVNVSVDTRARRGREFNTVILRIIMPNLEEECLHLIGALRTYNVYARLMRRKHMYTIQIVNDSDVNNLRTLLGAYSINIGELPESRPHYYDVATTYTTSNLLPAAIIRDISTDLLNSTDWSGNPRTLLEEFASGSRQPVREHFSSIMPRLEEERMRERRSRLETFLSRDYLLDRILTITRRDYSGPVYDLSVPGVHNFEAGGIIVHNCIDELDKMGKEDSSGMHEALEQQQISIAKAGITATLQSRCSLLAAANPKYGRFDQSENVLTQINMLPSLISRFDLIFPIFDNPNPRDDSRIAEHILRVHQEGGMLMHRQAFELDPAVQEGRPGETVRAELDVDLIRKYVAHAKRMSSPVLDDDAASFLTDYYVRFRKSNKDPRAVPITARQLEALVRLTEASARIRLSSRATKTDAERAVRVMQYSLVRVAQDAEGNIDIDHIGGVPQKTRSRLVTLRKIMERLSKESQDGIFILADVIREAKNLNIASHEVENFVNKMRDDGSIHEPTHGKYRFT